MELKKTYVVDAPTEDTWSLLAGQFGDVGTWTSAIQSSQLTDRMGPSAIRQCILPNGKWIREQVTGYDAAKMTFDYKIIEGAPAWIKEASNQFTVQPMSNNRTKVMTRTVIRLPFWLWPFSPLVRINVKRMTNRFMDETRHFLETGKVHRRVARAKIKKPMI